jgi:mRNA interferase MazF
LEDQFPQGYFYARKGEDKMGRKNRPVKIRKKSLPDVTRIQPPKRMDIWYAHLRENTGTSVQEGSRPVLVISNDMANKNSDVVTVIPLTSQMKRIELPTHCIIRDLLDEDSVVLAEQITAIPKWRLHRKLCSCTDEVQVNEIERAVKVQLGLEDI